MYDIRDVARMFTDFAGGDPPCNFNGMDERSDEWCDGKCGEVDSVKCWEHAIEEGWF